MHDLRILIRVGDFCFSFRGYLLCKSDLLNKNQKHQLNRIEAVKCLNLFSTSESSLIEDAITY